MFRAIHVILALSPHSCQPKQNNRQKPTKSSLSLLVPTPALSMPDWIFEYRMAAEVQPKHQMHSPLSDFAYIASTNFYEHFQHNLDERTLEGRIQSSFDISMRSPWMATGGW